MGPDMEPNMGPDIQLIGVPEYGTRKGDPSGDNCNP